MARYFIVFYISNTSNQGHVALEKKSGDFLNANETREIILKLNPAFSAVAITNIIEISQEDYKMWNKETH